MTERLIIEKEFEKDKELKIVKEYIIDRSQVNFDINVYELVKAVQENLEDGDLISEIKKCIKIQPSHPKCTIERYNYIDIIDDIRKDIGEDIILKYNEELHKLRKENLFLKNRLSKAVDAASQNEENKQDVEITFEKFKTSKNLFQKLFNL